MNNGDAIETNVSGEFVDRNGERFYAIRNVDQMEPFFISVVSDDDHWLFISSTGSLTAGRVSPETALFPYVTVDKIHDGASHTGSKTILRAGVDGQKHYWEPFNREQNHRFSLNRHLYKSLIGNKLCFEEVNNDLQLVFRYTWETSDRFGFVRRCELHNSGNRAVSVELVDGLQNILPAGTPRFAQTNTSNLVDAYKWTELDQDTGLALFTLYSGITDRAEPSESLKANTVFNLGLDQHKTLVSSQQLEAFRNGESVETEYHRRGIRGAYFVNFTSDLKPDSTSHWCLVANIEQTQAQVVELRNQLGDRSILKKAIRDSVDRGSDRLARFIASGDGFQVAAEETVTAHHCANVLFNILRGGIFDDQYNVTAQDFSDTVRHFNDEVWSRNREILTNLPDKIHFNALWIVVKKSEDRQLQRLCLEYLPIHFGRRHGDPSRPWNQFVIRLKDEQGNDMLSYAGNWRDIFQNWEAMSFSYPEFVENIIAKFVNASTADGYNPYRITKQGIDWEVEEPDDPWSYIGYWGDHQIIYLQKLLELSRQFHPEKLTSLLHEPIFSYANVPYRIKAFEELLETPKDTVSYDVEAADQIEQRVAVMGADGKLILDADGAVYQVNLLEKLLVPLLSKLGNLVVDGGIWLNTQRPEWNDANNALVGHGLSMVTLYYMRRYIHFLQQLLNEGSGTSSISREVRQWLVETGAALKKLRPLLGAGPVSETQRYTTLAELGQAASRYRQTIYQQTVFSGSESLPLDDISVVLDDALAAIDHSIDTNKGTDGLYHAYNILSVHDNKASVDALYPMLEGQVAALSAGVIAPQEVVTVLVALYDSAVYRADQHSFLLYPDRKLPGFLDKNRVPAEKVKAIPFLQRLLKSGDQRVIVRDADGCFRFNAAFSNVSELNTQLDAMTSQYGADIETARGPLQALYEEVFNHRAFTGRSGGMFGFEGLGSIYWHMVAKLLLAVQENYFTAIDQAADPAICHRLGQLYYEVRSGIGFNKTPAEYGAFPVDPYSHTPGHAGAQQPGMTGQVKEEVLSRFGELGVRVSDGTARFVPSLLRAREFVAQSRPFRFLDVDSNWQTLPVPPAGLAFSWCQVPVIYRLNDQAQRCLTVTFADGTTRVYSKPALPATLSAEVFNRSGRIRQLDLTLGTSQLHPE